MSAFADSSALVKLYVDEPGHEFVRGYDDLLVSAIAQVEVPAALWRKVRVGDMDAEVAGTLVADFAADHRGTPDQAPRFTTVALDGRVLDMAAALAAAHTLRAYDAVQLATARLARDVVPTCTALLAYDIQLRAAASASGFTLLPAAI